MRKNTKGLGLILLISTCLCAYNASGADYMTVDEYHRQHPEQITKNQSFNRVVSQQGIPMNPGVQKRTARITFIYPGKQLSDYWRRSIRSFERRADEIGLDYQLDVLQTKGGTMDLNVQRKYLSNALKKEPDYLVYTLNVTKHQRFIERIITRGKPKVIIQNFTTPLRRWEGKQPMIYIGFDHVRGTKILANHLLRTTGGNGSYAVLFFSTGFISELRGDTLINLMNRKSNLKLKTSFYTNAQREKARLAVLDMLREGPIDFIYACATDIAFGAMDALKEMGKQDQVLLNGWGGGTSELEAIERGDLDFTVMRMNDDNGVAMAEAIRMDQEKRSSEIPVIFSGKMVLVTKGTPAERVKAFKARAFRYSGIEMTDAQP